MENNKIINDILDLYEIVAEKTEKLIIAFDGELNDYNNDVYDRVWNILTDLFGSKCSDCFEVMADALFKFQHKEIDRKRLFQLIKEAQEEQEEELNCIEKDEDLE